MVIACVANSAYPPGVEGLSVDGLSVASLPTLVLALLLPRGVGTLSKDGTGLDSGFLE